jgi:hypothetical protein
MNKEIIDLEKNNFSEFHSEFNKLLHNVNICDKNLDITNISKLSNINKELLNLTNLIKDFNLSIKKNNNQELDINSINKLKSFDKDKKTINSFLPYMLYYRMIIDL